MSRLLSRRRALAALAFAVVAVLVGVSLSFLQARSATITLTAAPGGHISPSGETHTTVGSQLLITAYDDDPSWQVGLMVGGQIVAPTPTGNGRYVYTLTVTGDTSVQASFAQLADNVRLVDPAAGAAIESVSADQREVIFTRSTPVVDQLGVGDILVNGAGSGYPRSLLVRVLAVGHDGNRIVLTTVPVPLTSAVLQASVQLSVPLPLTAPPSTGPTGSPTVLTPFGPPIVQAADAAFDGFQMSLAHTWTDQGGGASASASVEGQLNVSRPALNVDLHISIDGLFPPSGRVDLFRASVSEQASASLALDAQASYAMKQEALLIDRDLAMIWFAIGPFPVEVSPHLAAGVGIDMTATGHMHAEGGISGNLESGVRYENGNWFPVQHFEIHPHGSVTLDAAAAARVYPILNLSANIYSLCGPYVNTQPGFLELNADANADPWWKLDAGIHLAAGAKCTFTDPYDIAGGDVLRQTVASAGGPLLALATASPLPSASSDATPSPSFTPAALGFRPDFVTRVAALCDTTPIENRQPGPGHPFQFSCVIPGWLPGEWDLGWSKESGYWVVSVRGHQWDAAAATNLSRVLMATLDPASATEVDHVVATGIGHAFAIKSNVDISEQSWPGGFTSGWHADPVSVVRPQGDRTIVEWWVIVSEL